MIKKQFYQTIESAIADLKSRVQKKKKIAHQKKSLKVTGGNGLASISDL